MSLSKIGLSALVSVFAVVACGQGVIGPSTGGTSWTSGATSGADESDSQCSLTCSGDTTTEPLDLIDSAVTQYTTPDMPEGDGGLQTLAHKHVSSAGGPFAAWASLSRYTTRVVLDRIEEDGENGAAVFRGQVTLDDYAVPFSLKVRLAPVRAMLAHAAPDALFDFDVDPSSLSFSMSDEANKLRHFEARDVASALDSRQSVPTFCANHFSRTEPTMATVSGVRVDSFLQLESPVPRGTRLSPEFIGPYAKVDRGCYFWGFIVNGCYAAKTGCVASVQCDLFDYTTTTSTTTCQLNVTGQGSAGGGASGNAGCQINTTVQKVATARKAWIGSTGKDCHDEGGLNGSCLCDPDATNTVKDCAAAQKAIDDAANTLMMQQHAASCQAALCTKPDAGK